MPEPQNETTSQHGTHFDVVTLGEAMIRLTPPGLRRIEQAGSFDVEIGGSEANVAVGLARLGLRTAWVSRMTDNPLGRLVTSRIAAHGVDVSHVVWTGRDRVGVYYLEEGRPPRESSVIYDRAGSAMSRMTPGDLPATLFRPGAARWLHVSGITPAIGEAAAATNRRAVELAQAGGWGVSLDLNYRARLWSPAEAMSGCEPLAARADVLIISSRDAETVCGVKGETREQTLTELARRFPRATVVLTMSKDGAAGRDPDGGYVDQPAFPAEPVGRIGGGDAFAAGFLYGYLSRAIPADRRLAHALRWGAAAAALKYATPGDMPIIERAAVERLASQEPRTGGDVVR